ncbi:MAG: saccharopine dehydrogenase NADP-binding domain-containing protein, partial [Elusimicrobia bacterium]|nr:saccharopine dehydrogenase NADP-binding domain-containing protein [Elusimicrobiota bacterium]
MPGRYSYLILGSGRQGTAAAYDVLRHGEASCLVLADRSLEKAKEGVTRIRSLLGQRPGVQLLHKRVDVSRSSQLRDLFKGHSALLSALPYYHNPKIASLAIESKVSYCDLGGYFEMTKKIGALDSKAKKAGVTLVPDCGVSPGMCNSLAVSAMEKLDRTEDVSIYCGGLPQNPKPPLGYQVVFNLEGVLGNYFGSSYVLRNGRIKQIPSFSEKEILSFGKPLGKLEAFVTGGATSTCPWTFHGKIKNYQYKTLRYPGHYEKIKLLKDLGLMENDPIQFEGQRISPRKFFAAVAEPRLTFRDRRDILVMKVIARGKRGGVPCEIVYDVLDRYDPKTRFSAMQRTTGFSAAIVLEMLAMGKIHAKG